MNSWEKKGERKKKGRRERGQKEQMMAGGREVEQIAMERRKRGSKVSQPRLQLVKPTVGGLDGRTMEME